MTGPPPNQTLPLAGLKVVEFAHMVMGPSCGLILADLGADVIKVEPPAGDATRRLIGSGAGFFPAYNRNKRSLAVDVKTPAGREIVLKLVARADVFSENFRPEAMTALGFDYPTLSKLNPRLVHVSMKGFLPGPYENRTALDEVVQMMGGLAYMTGPSGRPLRAGASVNDVMGGMFAAMAAMAALMRRDHPVHGTGEGAEVKSALFENTIFLVAQHMMQFSVTGKPAAPMPERISAWGVYDVFEARDGEQIFLAVVSDAQWRAFCEAFGYADLAGDDRLSDNNGRVRARDWLMPDLRARLALRPLNEIADLFETHGLPFARIARPHDLFEDRHLVASGGLAPVTLSADASSAGEPIETMAALLPVEIDGIRPPLRLPPPGIGADTAAILADLGYAPGAVAALARDGVIRLGAG